MKRRRARAAKRAVDVLGSTVLLVVTAPVALVAALAVRLTVGAPVFFRDERAGSGGRPFMMFKFRTMRPLREGERVPDSDELRTSRVGRWLRATSIDELPSFFNVLRGEMSLVGPRPLPMRYSNRFTPEQVRRLEAQPGITGLAQVRGRNALSWDDKLALDVWYVDHQSMGLDARILLSTPAAVLRRREVGHRQHATMPEFGGAEPEPGNGT